MSAIQDLSEEALFEIIEEYQQQYPITPEVEALEGEIEQRVYDRLSPLWENGWDFCTQTDFFGDGGVSILIQNRKVEWQAIWDFLVKDYSELPVGALINFEVWDSILDGAMIAGEMQMRRIVSAKGIYSENT